MKKLFLKIFFFFSLFSLQLFAQANGNDFGVSLNINYTTTSRIYLQPDSPDPIVRNTSRSLDGINSYSFDFRYQVSESVIFGIGSEFIKKTFDNSINLGGVRAMMNDGYRVIPVELSIYYHLPFSTEHFKFFMGGGFGFYIGEQVRNLGDVSISNETKKIGYGIHVAVGMDYVVSNFLSLRGQMRFRDPEFEMKSIYSSNIVNYDGRAYLLPSQTFSSKVNIDGITFTVGVVINFRL